MVVRLRVKPVDGGVDEDGADDHDRGEAPAAVRAGGDVNEGAVAGMIVHLGRCSSVSGKDGGPADAVI
jgi:hypothetical protein